MAKIDSKLNLSEKYFSQASGETLTLSGNTIIQGGLNFGAGYIPTGDTSVPTKAYIDQNGVDSLTFQEGVIRSGNNIELGGSVVSNVNFDSRSILNLGGNVRLTNRESKYIPISIVSGSSFQTDNWLYIADAIEYNQNNIYRAVAYVEIDNIDDIYSDYINLYLPTGSGSYEEFRFTEGNNPNGWSGTTLSINPITVLYQLFGFDQFFLAREIAGDSGITTEIYGFDINNKNVISLSGNIPAITASTLSYNDNIWKYVGLRPISSGNTEYVASFNDIDNNTLYIYNSFGDTLTSYQSGSTVSGDITTLPDFKNAMLLYTKGNTESETYDDGVVIETYSNNPNDRYLLLDTTSDSVTKIQFSGLTNQEYSDLFEIIDSADAYLLPRVNIIPERFGGFIPAAKEYSFSYYISNNIVNLNFTGTTASIDIINFPNGIGTKNQNRSAELSLTVNQAFVYDNFNRNISSTFFGTTGIYNFPDGVSDSNDIVYASNNFVPYIKRVNNIYSLNLTNLNTNVFTMNIDNQGLVYPSSYEPGDDNLLTKRYYFNNLRYNSLNSGLIFDEFNVSLGGIVKDNVEFYQPSGGSFNFINDTKFTNRSVSEILNFIEGNAATYDNFKQLNENGGFIALSINNEEIIYVDNILTATTVQRFSGSTLPNGFSGDTAFNQAITDVDADGNYIYFTTSNGLYRIDLTGQTYNRIIGSTATIDGVTISSSNTLLDTYDNKILIANSNGEFYYFTDDLTTMLISYTGGIDNTLNGEDSIANGLFYESARIVVLDNIEYISLISYRRFYLISLDGNKNVSYIDRDEQQGLSNSVIFDANISESNFSGNILGVDFTNTKPARVAFSTDNSNRDVYIYEANGSQLVAKTIGANKLLTIDSGLSIVTQIVYNSVDNLYYFFETNISGGGLNGFLFTYDYPTERLNVRNSEALYSSNTSLLGLSLVFNDPNKFVVAKPQSLSTIKLYQIDEFTVEYGDNGFQYPSNYIPTQPTSLITLDYFTGNTSSGGTSSGNIQDIIVVSANTTLVNTNYNALVDTSANTITVTLPSAPIDGQVHEIKDYAGGAAVNNITISGNTRTIDNSATVVISSNYSIVKMIYSQVLDSWFIK